MLKGVKTALLNLCGFGHYPSLFIAQMSVLPPLTCGPCGVIVVGAIIATCLSSTVSILSCIPCGIVAFLNVM